MIKDRKRLIIFILIAICLLIVTSCSNETLDNVKSKGNNNENNNENDNNISEYINSDESITILIGDHNPEDDFEQLYKIPIEGEFSNITVERIQFNTKEDIEEALTSNLVPDLLIGHQPQQIQVMGEHDLLTNMEDLFDKYGYDLDRFQQPLLNTFRSYNNGILSGVPINRVVYGLHYNRDIFDQFGVEYPSNGMTWDEVIELAQEVTGERGDIQYLGLGVQNPDRMLLNVTILDPETEEPIIDSSPEIIEYFTRIENIFSIPGNLPENPDFIGDPHAMFVQERTLAMYTGYYRVPDLKNSEGLNWDVASYPLVDLENPMQPESQGHWIGISKHTEYEEITLQLLDFLLSDDMFRMRAETSGQLDPARIPLATAEEVLALDSNYYEGRNEEAYTAFDNAPGPNKRSKYEGELLNIVKEKTIEFAQSEEDVRTFLRKLQEEANGIIVDLKGDN